MFKKLKCENIGLKWFKSPEVANVGYKKTISKKIGIKDKLSFLVISALFQSCYVLAISK